MNDAWCGPVVTVLALVAAVWSGPATAQSKHVPGLAPELVVAGRAVIAALRSGDAAAIEARFADPIRQAVPHERFVATLAQIGAQVGALTSCGPPVARSSSGVTTAEYRCTFERATLTLRLSWSERRRLAGLVLVPLPPETADAAPLPPGVREEQIVTGAPGWPLPGTVLVPVGTARPPIVVLLHGSGTNDRDETIGASRPFLDLARGFAAHGIASLRYDKRTYTLGPRFVDEVSAPTLDDEIVDDAVAALAAAAHRDLGPVFIVGHSEGAWLAPRIAAAAAAQGVAVAGVVMLAAPLTPFVDLIVEQYAFLAALKPPGATVEMVDEMRQRREHVRQLVRDGSVPDGTTLPLNLPASLWLDLGRYDPGAALLALPGLPALLTFGRRDFQVPVREEGLWRERLAGRPDTTLVVFDAMNHLLIDGSGPMTPAEYNRPGHVSGALIERVSAWILQRAGAGP